MTPRPTPPPAIVPPPGRRPERKILRLSDGYETSVYVHHPPAGAPAGKLPVLYVHGIQSHPGWFYGSALVLAGAGHAVYQVTRRGSGDNRLARGDTPSRKRLFEDVTDAVKFLQTDSGGSSGHLVGVSWGGKLLAAYLACRRQEAAASLTLLAPGVMPRVDVSLRVKIRIAGNLLVRPTARHDIPLSEPELFTDNEAMQAFLHRDAFRLHQATARFLFENRKLDYDLRRAPKGCLSVPTTLILASRDRIIDNAATRAMVQRLAGENLTIVELEGSHTLEFEADPSAYFRQVIAAVTRGQCR